MRIFVDELPKLCAYCPYYYGNSQGAVCKLTGIITKWNETLGEMQSKCTLQSIAEHDKQVRKEVCEEIRSRFLSTCQIEKGCDTASFSLGVLNRILDQIEKGEI